MWCEEVKKKSSLFEFRVKQFFLRSDYLFSTSSSNILFCVIYIRCHLPPSSHNLSFKCHEITNTNFNCGRYPLKLIYC